MIPMPWAAFAIALAVIIIASSVVAVYIGAADPEGRAGTVVMWGLIAFALAVALLVYAVVSVIWH